MIFIKKYSNLKVINIFICLLALNFLTACSQTQIITGAAGSAVAVNQDEKTLGDVVDDTAISLGIREKLFMFDASLLAKVSINVELGKVLLTGKLKNQNLRVEVVRLAWKQSGVVEVLNEIKIENPDDFSIKKYAEDKLIKTQLLAKVFTDNRIKKLKYNFEVQDKIIYIMGISTNKEELGLVFEHARNIKGVQDIISYVDIISLDDADS